MADIIPFPQREDIETLRFDEKHVFGELGGLTLSLVQEEGKEDGPLLLVLIGGADGFLPLQVFEPTPDGRNLAMLTGDITLRALAAAQATWSE
jgi:hypothetical protein